jgi:hypothetical protein
LRRLAPGARCDAASVTGGPTFDQLLAEGGSVPLEGWDFSWFEGRATEERPRWVVFYDVGAVVHFLRKVPWTVPGFAVDGYTDQLARMHRRIRSRGPFVSYARRFLIEARKPD